MDTYINNKTWNQLEYKTLRDIPNTNGKYKISIDTKEGVCISFFKNKPHKLSNNTQHNRIFWNISFNGTIEHQQAARWIALTYPEFVQNKYFNGAHIDHIDTDTLNNHPSNLRWVTPKENQNNPLTKSHLSTSQLNRKDVSKPIQQYSKNGEYIATYLSAMDAHRQTGLHRGHISDCCRGVTKTNGGYKWFYADSTIGQMMHRLSELQTILPNGFQRPRVLPL